MDQKQRRPLKPQLSLKPKGVAKRTPITAPNTQQPKAPGQALQVQPPRRSTTRGGSATNSSSGGDAADDSDSSSEDDREPAAAGVAVRRARAAEPRPLCRAAGDLKTIGGSTTSSGSDEEGDEESDEEEGELKAAAKEAAALRRSRALLAGDEPLPRGLSRQRFAGAVGRLRADFGLDPEAARESLRATVEHWRDWDKCVGDC